jgi:hypothetical protein
VEMVAVEWKYGGGGEIRLHEGLRREMRMRDETKGTLDEDLKKCVATC